MKFTRVAGDDAHVFDLHAEYLRDDLREDREVSLPLRADSSGDPNLAARFDGHTRAFVRTDACAFHITGDAETDVLPLRPQSRLLSFDERVVTNQLRRLIERRPIVSAVVDQWPRILKHDLVIVRKPI